MRRLPWFPLWHTERDAVELFASVARAAAAGEPIQKLLELTARGLLVAGRVDRAGVWLEGSEKGFRAEGLVWEGHVVNADFSAVPEQWNRLNASAPALKLVLQGRDAAAVGLTDSSGAPLIPAVTEMRSVLWLPLRVREMAVGLAMVASAKPRARWDISLLQSLAMELAVVASAARSIPLGGPAIEPPDRLEAELESVLDAVDCGVLLLNDAGRIRFVNAWLAQLLGLEGRRLAKLTQRGALVRAVEGRFRDPRSFARDPAEVYQQSSESAREELELVRLTRRILERLVRPVVDGAERRLGWLEVYRDITSQRVIQSKLLQTEKMAAIGQLVSGIAHELNNPLTGIMGYAQLLLGHGLAPEQLADAQRIYQEAERARHIVKNLLLFAREAKLERTPVDLNEIVERTLALRSYELKVEDIQVDLDLDPDLPQTLADPIQLQQVVLNLLVNGEQAILQARGRGRISIRTRRLATERLALEVSDDGPGIPPEIASRIFDPFFTTKPPGVGTGLGLSIVYGIVQQHGGEVYVDSQPGRGATFVVELPLVEVSPEERAARCAKRPRAAVGGRRILVVEDEATIGQLIADVLREERHEVEVVLDSQEALTRIARQNYDLVICDLRMPRLDGQAFYQALVTADSPVRHRLIFITGDTLSPRTLGFLKKSGVPYLTKPFLVEELKLAVSRLLESVPKELRAADVGPGSSQGN